MSGCACMRLLSSRCFSNVERACEGECPDACLLSGGEVRFAGAALNWEPTGIVRFRVPRDRAVDTALTNVTVMLFVVRGGAQPPGLYPNAGTRAATAEPADDPLTPHEKRVLKLLVQGHGYKSAAVELGVTTHTVSFHLRRVYQKLDVHSKTEAVSKALREGLI